MYEGGEMDWKDEIKVKVILERFGNYKFMPNKITGEDLDICVERAIELTEDKLNIVKE